MAVKKTTEKKSPQTDLKDFLTEIEKKAYEIYQERQSSSLSGNDLSDWLAAEKEIKARYNI